MQELMQERKMGLADTPRCAPAIASVCRATLLQAERIATEASRFVDTLVASVVAESVSFTVRKIGLHTQTGNQHLSSNKTVSPFAAATPQQDANHQLHIRASLGILTPAHCTAQTYAEQPRATTPDPGSRLTEIHTRRQLTSGWSRMEPTDPTN